MKNSSEIAEKWLQGARQSADWVGVRFIREKTSSRTVRNDLPERNQSFIDEGAMVEVMADGHLGYAATADLSAEGLQRAFERALRTTRAAARHKAFAFSPAVRPKAAGHYRSPRRLPLDQASLAEITDVLTAATAAMKISGRIVNRSANAMLVSTESRFLSSNGSDVRQDFDMVLLNIMATAVDGRETQTRSSGGLNSLGNQIGAEIFNRDDFRRDGERLGREAEELLRADNCPEERTDVIIMPDQMMLQIHESIGHPLELDRILGDERNYAGWSFVKPEDFGNLRYGSALMNVTFDPGRSGQLASYAFDDSGHAATREFLIKDGLLLRGLGSLESQERAGLPGVANFRSSSWNRAPIDRMANINLEPGAFTLEEMIASVEKGVLMTSNRSWSIDDERNKFQFGCEHARLIEDGRLTKTLKNPNYRGFTVDFWNRLTAVGGADLVGTYGTAYCGKGEPNQAIRVGHASPPCLFRGVEIFGGAS
ncbi:MAG: TldD/PmbA family protein [Bdellovibrionaceae bacterium]|nr:TldD/PmbA family protein [Pseudobdellovibrionaceae bacterium]